MISVIVPAYNEGLVIARTLSAMIDGADAAELDVIVVCNGCTDNTASVARRFGPPVRVIETNIASKTHALNLGDEAARSFPRVYADADVVITCDVIRRLARRLERGDVLAVAPIANYDRAGCSWPVRACLDIRSYLPSSQEGIGGSGVYALSETGRRRFRSFPVLTADDGYVRIQFRTDERETLHSASSTVFPPRTLKGLIVTKTRAHYGSSELRSLFPELWKNSHESNDKTLIRLFRNPRLWPKLMIYCAVTAIARGRAKKRRHGSTAVWERDHTSRVLV